MTKKQPVTLGLPPGMKVFSPYPFAGLNVSSGRPGLRDQQFYDVENFILVGAGNLRTLWDVGDAAYSAPSGKTIVNTAFYNVGPSQYAAVFLSDGTAVQVTLATGATTSISGVSGTFYNGGNLPCFVQWGSQYLVVGNNHQPNAYWVWDSSLLYGAGSISPNVTLVSSGGGYTSAPTVTAYGGAGSGAKFQAIVQNGYVVGVYVTNPGSGYEVGDEPLLAFTGGGTDNSAQLVAVLSGGAVTEIVVTNGGSGYTSAPTVNITAPPSGGTQATATAVISAGVVTSIVINNGGSGYTSTPFVTLGAGYGATATATLESGSGASGTAVLTGGAVSSITLGSGGSGYTSVPLVAIDAPPAGGTQATAVAVLTGGAVSSFTVTNGGSGYTTTPGVTIYGGDVASIAVTNGGADYTGAPTVVIDPPAAGGTQATATATVTSGAVTAITVTNKGAGYTSVPNVSLVQGTEASAYAVISAGTLQSIKIEDGGTGYSTAPTLTIVGGGGTGATATATVSHGVITSTSITNAGSGYTSTPAVVVEGGINRAAAATVSIMPYGVSGTCIEAFLSRVWIGNIYTPPTNPAGQNNGNKFQFSAPDSLSDFATSDGGGLYTSSDRFLKVSYTAFRQSNGYLYPLGDSSAAIISGVTTSGNPATTTFQYQNTDPQVGTPWRDSCQDFGRAEIFANQLGVYALYGGAVTKISSMLDPIFVNGIFPPAAGAITPSSAVANIFGGKYYCLLMTIVDPITLVSTNKMILWGGSENNNWFLASQSVNLVQIYTQEVGSNLTAWGTDGKSLYPLFQKASTKLTKKLSTKLYGWQTPYIAKTAYMVMVQAQNQSTPGGPVDFALTVDTEAGSYPLYAPDGSTSLSFSLANKYETGYATVSNALTEVSGIFLGVSLSTTDADVTLNNLGLGYLDVSLQMASIGTVLDPLSQ